MTFGDGVIDRRALVAMRDSLLHRGPDETGLLEEGSFGMFSTHISVLDLHDGAQPITTTDKRFRIVYNGETYNFQALRRRRPDVSGAGSYALRHPEKIWALLTLELWFRSMVSPQSVETAVRPPRAYGVTSRH